MKMNKIILPLAGTAAAAALALIAVCNMPERASASAADPAARAAFIDSNMLAMFYHEMGHALIDQMQLPVLGREEDAADSLAVVLIDGLWERPAAEDLARDVARSWLLSDLRAEREGHEPPWWDTHSMDLQRYYNHVCLFYGADPENREQIARDLELPEERAETCVDEFRLALAGWGPAMDKLSAEPPARGAGRLIMAPGDGGAPVLRKLIEDEVNDLNREIGLPRDLAVRVESCGEANAFYAIDENAIIMCSEMPEDFGALFDSR